MQIKPDMPLETGVAYFFTALPVAIVGYFSAKHQGNVATAGMQILAKRPEDMMKGVILAAMVETYAILAFVVSFLLTLRRLRASFDGLAYEAKTQDACNRRKTIWMNKPN